MKRIIFTICTLSLISLLFACSPKSPVPSTTSETVILVKEQQAIVKESPLSEWEKVLEKARREGKVVLYGPPGDEQRKALTQGFEKSYPGILVDYVAGPGSALAAKMLSERKSGIYLVDLHIGGTTTILTSLKDVAVPIAPLLLPEIRDGKNWMGGKLDFADNEEKFNLVFTTAIKVAIAYNSQMLEPSRAETLSFWDLAKPEWKGKLVMTDVRMAGPGLTTANFIVLHPELGEKYLWELAKNDVILSRDERLLAEWVARGKYPVQISPGTFIVNEFQTAGLPIKLKGELKEGAPTTAAYGSVVVLENAPHPNAARFYMNWLLSKEAQLSWSKASGYASRRIDVSTTHLDPETVPKPGREYIAEYKEKYTGGKDILIKKMQEIFK